MSKSTVEIPSRPVSELPQESSLIKEIERYLAAVALFRELGCQPTWIREPARAPNRIG